MKKKLIVGTVALALSATSCKTTQNNAELLQDDQKKVNVLPKSVLDRADKVVQDQANREFLKMLVDLAILREKLPQDVQVTDEIKGYWTNSVYKTVQYSIYGTVGIATAGSLHKSAENVQSYANLVNAIAAVAAKWGKYSSDRSEKIIEVIFSNPLVKKSVEASSETAEFSVKAVERVLVGLFGEKAAKYAFGGSIGLSVLGSIPSSQSFQGEAGIRRSEWVQSVTGYRTQIAEATQSYVDTMATALRWSSVERNRFHEAFVQSIINIAISNDFDPRKEYSVDPFALMAQLGMANERSQVAAKLFNTFDAFTSSTEKKLTGEMKTRESIELMAGAAAQLQATLNAGQFSRNEKGRINLLLSNTLTTIKKWESLYDPTKGL